MTTISSSLLSAWQRLSAQPSSGLYAAAISTLAEVLKAREAGKVSLNAGGALTLEQTAQNHIVPWLLEEGWDAPGRISTPKSDETWLVIGQGRGTGTVLQLADPAPAIDAWRDLSWFLRMAAIRDPLTDHHSVTSSLPPRLDKLLERSAGWAPLETLMRYLETQRPQLLASVLVNKRGHLQIGAAPSLPQEFLDKINGLQIGPQAGSCGTAAYYQRPIYTLDIAQDRRWDGFSDLATQRDLAACWSVPLVSDAGRLLGTLALYATTPAAPTPHDLEWMHAMSQWATYLIDSQSKSVITDDQEIPAPIVAFHDKDGRFTEIRSSGLLLGSYHKEDLLGHYPGEFTHPGDWYRMASALQEMRTNGSSRAIYRVRRKTTEFQWIESILTDLEPGILFQSVTRELTPQEVRQLFRSGELMLDPITRLPLSGFWDAGSLAFAEQFDLVALIVIELDQYPVFAAHQGRVRAARVMRLIADTTRDHLNPKAIVTQITESRIGVLIDAPAKGVAARLLETINEVLNTTFEDEWTPTVSVGMVQAQYQSSHLEKLLHQATIALVEAQAAGGAQCKKYNPDMESRRLKAATMEGELKRALIKDQFMLMFQPIVSMQTRQIQGFEALLRWNHPERGLIAPADFIPAAERTGVIVPMGAWVLRESLLAVQSWQLGSHCLDLGINVNVSARQLEDPQFINMVKNTLKQTGFNPALLKLEITESILVKNLDQVVAIMAELHSLGVLWSLDDFGTGYSSLAALHNLPLDEIKIDRTFVMHSEEPKTRAIIQATIAVARTFMLDIVAEGVEQEAEWALLQGLGCQRAQGYLIAPPLVFNQATLLIASQEIVDRP